MVKYDTWRRKVKNLNAVTGSTINPKKSYKLFYILSFAFSAVNEGYSMSPTQSAILSTGSAGTLSGKSYKNAERWIYERWRGAIDKSATVLRAYDAYTRGVLSLSEFNQIAKDWSDDLRLRRKEYPGAGSD